MDKGFDWGFARPFPVLVGEIPKEPEIPTGPVQETRASKTAMRKIEKQKARAAVREFEPLTPREKKRKLLELKREARRYVTVRAKKEKKAAVKKTFHAPRPIADCAPDWLKDRLA